MSVENDLHIMIYTHPHIIVATWYVLKQVTYNVKMSKKLT